MGSIFTAGGQKLPSKPNVGADVVKWGKVVNRLRKDYTPEQVMEFFVLIEEAFNTIDVVDMEKVKDGLVKILACSGGES